MISAGIYITTRGGLVGGEWSRRAGQVVAVCFFVVVLPSCTCWWRCETAIISNRIGGESNKGKQYIQYVPIVIAGRTNFLIGSVRGLVAFVRQPVVLPPSVSYSSTLGVRATTGLFSRHGQNGRSDGTQRRPLDPVFVICHGRSGARLSGVHRRRRFGFISSARFLAALVGPPKMRQTRGPKLCKCSSKRMKPYNVARRRKPSIGMR
jgi:hypothetical protein